MSPEEARLLQKYYQKRAPSIRSTGVSGIAVVLRCHDFPNLIKDTLHSVYHYLNDPIVLLAIDDPQGLKGDLAHTIVEEFPKIWVMYNYRKWGWGPGLYNQILESHKYLKVREKFNHLLSIDYDTLFINYGIESEILNLVSKDPNAGLLGYHYPRGIASWGRVYNNERLSFDQHLKCSNLQYKPGESVSGGFMLFTNKYFEEVDRRNYDKNEWSNVKNWTAMADDALSTLVCRACGLSVVDTSKIGYTIWTMDKDPLSLSSFGYKVMHPTKLRGNVSGHLYENSDSMVRNYYRKLRKLEKLPYNAYVSYRSH